MFTENMKIAIWQNLQQLLEIPPIELRQYPLVWNSTNTTDRQFFCSDDWQNPNPNPTSSKTDSWEMEYFEKDIQYIFCLRTYGIPYLFCELHNITYRKLNKLIRNSISVAVDSNHPKVTERISFLLLPSLSFSFSNFLACLVLLLLFNINPNINLF